MTPKEIQNALKANKTTQKAVAIRLGVSEMTVSNVVRKRVVSDRVMTAVAGALGKPKADVFPEYYYGPRRRKTSKAIGPIQA